MRVLPHKDVFRKLRSATSTTLSPKVLMRPINGSTLAQKGFCWKIIVLKTLWGRYEVARIYVYQTKGLLMTSANPVACNSVIQLTLKPLAINPPWMLSFKRSPTDRSAGDSTSNPPAGFGIKSVFTQGQDWLVGLVEFSLETVTTQYNPLFCPGSIYNGFIEFSRFPEIPD